MITTIYILLIFATSSSVKAQSMKKILPNDGAADDKFGVSVSIYQNTAVIGAYQDDDKGSGSGSAYIFTMNDTTNEWTQTAKLVASDGAAGDFFGISVSIYQNIAVIGAYGDDDDKGSVYIFTMHDTTKQWTQTAKLVASDGATGDYFGRSVSIYQNTVVIGAPYDDDKGTQSGSAYIFTFDNTTNEWTQTAKFVASDGAPGDSFGFSVSVYQNIAVIGAYQDDDGGSVYIFTFDDTTKQWTQTAKLVASDGAADDYFGFSVSIYQNTVVIGAHFDDDKGTNSGSVYLFTFDDTTKQWTQTAKLVASDGAASNYFGRSVSIYQNTAVIGAYNDDDKGSQSGSVYIFTFDNTTNVWTQTAKLVASDGAEGDLFGISVSIYQNTAVIGAYNDDKGSMSGSAYLLNLRNFASCQSVWKQSTEELLFNRIYTYLIQWEMTQCSFTTSPTNNPSSSPTNNPSSAPCILYGYFSYCFYCFQIIYYLLCT